MINKPAIVTLKSGSYYICRCGQSKNKPFCDGSHQGTEFSPDNIVLEQEQTVVICQCLKTNTSPFCDGSHSRLK